MSDTAFRNSLGIFLVTSHFLILLMVILFWLLGSFLTQEMTTSVAIIAPLFATYTAAIIRDIVRKKRHVRSGRRLTPAFVFLASLVPSLFVLLVACAVILKGFNIGLRSFDDFKTMLGLTETIFGIYVGQFVFSMFEPPEAPAKKTVPA